MGQPTPPGDIPLVDGLGAEWNDIVSAIPEDKRAELAPKFKERLSAYEPLKQWEDLQKSGITPEYANTALNVYNVLENNPKEVYEAIGKHLGITPAQAEQVVEELEEDDSGDPRIAALKHQVDTLSAITLAQRQQDQQSQAQAQADKELETELEGIKKKYGDFPEDEIVMRMIHKEMSAEQAYQEYMQRADGIRKRRPSPLIMGGGGSVPGKQIDVTKLDNKGTKNLVAQMLDHANDERNR